MTDEKSRDGAPKPPSPLANLSPLPSRVKPTRPPADPVEAPWELDRDRRAAEVQEPAPGLSLRKALGVGLGGTVIAGGIVAGGVALEQHVQMMQSATDSAINAIANGLASTSKVVSPEVRAEAESLLRTALSATWSECETLVKDMSEDVLKAIVETGVSAVVFKYVLNPLLGRLKGAPANPIVAEATSALQKIADKLADEPHAKLDERNVVAWTELTPEQAQLLLRALKLQERKDGRWLLETD
jgi:hypothetical protein